MSLPPSTSLFVPDYLRVSAFDLLISPEAAETEHAEQQGHQHITRKRRGHRAIEMPPRCDPAKQRIAEKLVGQPQNADPSHRGPPAGHEHVGIGRLDLVDLLLARRQLDIQFVFGKLELLRGLLDLQLLLETVRHTLNHVRDERAGETVQRTILAALAVIPRNEPIADDLLGIEAWNARARRMARWNCMTGSPSF